MVIQKTAPAPPMLIAIPTPAILPRPIVPDTAVHSAWNGLIRPSASLAAYFPFRVSIVCFKPRIFKKRKYKVKNNEPVISHKTRKGIFISGVNSNSKKIMLHRLLAKGSIAELI